MNSVKTSMRESSSAPVLYQRFLTQFALGDYDGAAELGEELLGYRYFPSLEEIFYLCGACYRQGKKPQALRLLRGLLVIIPGFQPGRELEAKITHDGTYRTTDNPVVPAVQVAAYRLFASRCRGSSVLEIGCGLGLGTRILAEGGGRVFATDLEETGVRHTRGHHPLATGYARCSATHLPFASKTFDYVTCVDVIEHIHDWPLALEEMKRVARREVLISTPNRLSENTNPDGSPRNYWHLFEWSPSEISEAFSQHFERFAVGFLAGRGENLYWSSQLPTDRVEALVAVASVDPQTPDRGAGTDAQKPSVPAELYNTNYYLGQGGCEGVELFLASRGHRLSHRLEVVLDALQELQGLDGISCLDLGCGRGELSHHLEMRASRVVSLDYSAAAVDIASKVLTKAELIHADATEFLPNLQSDPFDSVLMVDFVEHLYDWQLSIVFEQVRRLTKPGGRVYINTPISPVDVSSQMHVNIKRSVEEFYPFLPGFVLDRVKITDPVGLDHLLVFRKEAQRSSVEPASDGSDQRSTRRAKSPRLHLVYAGNPCNDESVRAPETIANHLYRHFEKLLPVDYVDWLSTSPLDVGPDDVVLGHPHYDRRTPVQRAFAETNCKAKFLVFPFHHGIPAINMPFDPLVTQCTKVFSITGQYWYDTIASSPFAHWADRMIRVDMAVDAKKFPRVKRHFGPHGKRVMLYIGTDVPEKGVAHLARLVRETGSHLVFVGQIGASQPLFEGLPVTFLGPRDLTEEFLAHLAQVTDFFVNMSVSDANPTTILEMAAIGLPVLCTPESGYIRPDLVYPLKLTDLAHNVAVVNALQQSSESGLLERGTRARAIIEREYTWDRFCQTIEAGMEPYL